MNIIPSKETNNSLNCFVRSGMGGFFEDITRNQKRKED